MGRVLYSESVRLDLISGLREVPHRLPKCRYPEPASVLFREVSRKRRDHGCSRASRMWLTGQRIMASLMSPHSPVASSSAAPGTSWMDDAVGLITVMATRC